MIYFKKKGIVRIAEAWYETVDVKQMDCDIIRYKFISDIPQNAYSVERLFTIIIDLQRDENEIMNDIAKNTKYEIKRAKERDNVKVMTLLDKEQGGAEALAGYIDFFNVFAKSKQRNSISYSDVSQFFEAENLAIRSVIDSSTGDPISMHAYILSDGTARLLHSASHYRSIEDPEYRKMTARANRLLHWDDMRYFKGLGFSLYDMGGWYGGQEDLEKISINQFKESFGGIKKGEISCIVPVTLIGKLSVYARKIIRGK